MNGMRCMYCPSLVINIEIKETGTSSKSNFGDNEVENFRLQKRFLRTQNHWIISVIHFSFSYLQVYSFCSVVKTSKPVWQVFPAKSPPNVNRTKSRAFVTDCLSGLELSRECIGTTKPVIDLRSLFRKFKETRNLKGASTSWLEMNLGNVRLTRICRRVNLWGYLLLMLG